MLFHATTLDGPRLIEPEPTSDERGFFARTFCEREFAAEGLPINFPQHSVSFNALAGTLRGMHYQLEPNAEAKVVRCTSGAILDVIVDVRTASPTYGRWESFVLSARNGHQLFIPEGFAHGFQALADETVVGYLISAFHVPIAARSFRFDDPTVGITWPLQVTVISPKDRQAASFPG